MKAIDKKTEALQEIKVDARHAAEILSSFHYLMKDSGSEKAKAKYKAICCAFESLFGEDAFELIEEEAIAMS